jgi:hypothetical protein
MTDDDVTGAWIAATGGMGAAASGSSARAASEMVRSGIEIERETVLQTKPRIASNSLQGAPGSE